MLRMGMAAFLMGLFVLGAGCGWKDECEQYDDLMQKASQEACGGKDETCWMCRCHNLGMEMAIFHVGNQLYGWLCVPGFDRTCRADPSVAWDDCDCAHDPIVEICLDDPDTCKAEEVEHLEMYCQDSPVTTCDEDAECPFSEEYCLDGICAHKPCSCDDGSQDILCESATCQREGEMCQIEFCALEGF